MFARAIGDTSAAYSDETFAETGLAGAAAPPTFVQASAQFDPEYVLRPHPGRPWLGSTDSKSGNGSASGGAGAVLHAEQRFEFARPVRVGDVLVAHQRAGRVWDKVGRKGGKLIFTETITEYRGTSGELVATATAVAVQPDRMPGAAAEPAKESR